VARWDWDAVHRQQYIGIKCGAAWCEIGDSGFVPSPGVTSPPTFDPVPGVTVSPEAIKRTWRVKGWYDEQLVPVETETGSSQPSNVMATFIPSPALGRIEFQGKLQGQWVQVAVVALDGDLPPRQ